MKIYHSVLEGCRVKCVQLLSHGNRQTQCGIDDRFFCTFKERFGVTDNVP